MSTESILEKIRRQSREQVREIEKNGRDEAERRHAQILDAAQRDAQDIRARAQEECAQILQSARLSAQLEVRKNNLAARRRLLDEAFDAALETLCAADAKTREAFLERLVLENAPKDGATLTVCARDRALCTAKLADWQEQLGATLILSDADGDFDGGVYMSGASYDVDVTYARILQQVRRDAEPQIARLLFDVEE